MLDVAIEYFVSLIAVGGVFLLAILVAFLAKKRAGTRGRLALFLIGAILAGLAGFEKMGWSARPWGLGSPAQHFDDILFRVVWLTGLGFIFVGGVLGFLQSGEVPRNETETERKLPTLIPSREKTQFSRSTMLDTSAWRTP